MAKAYSFILCLFVGVLSHGQETTDILEYFNAVQTENVIQINFAIRGGASCQGVDLERSQDGLNFSVLDHISGVCGGSEFTEVYSFVDEAPFEYHPNYYRLRMGGQGRSEPIEITFVRIEDGYRIYPNPATDWAVIRYDNPSALAYQLNIYAPSGKLVESAVNIVSSEIYMDLSHYQSGTYIFQLVNSQDNPITGRLVVQ